MGKLHRTYDLTITTLSPLHIGTGNTLLRDYDYVVHGKNTWAIDAERLAEVLYDEGTSDFDDMVSGAAASEFLRGDDFAVDNPVFRYVLPGVPRAESRGSKLQELIKDPWDRPYIPGSSLKGALRTALAYVGWKRRKLTFDPAQLDSKKRFPALPLEHQVLFGNRKKPNDDLLRALQVSDTNSDEQKRMMLCNVQVLSGDKMGSPIELEAIQPNVTFSASLAVDGYLRQPEVARQLGWDEEQLKWLKSISGAARHFTLARLDDELKRWTNSPYPIRSFYSTLVRTIEGLDKGEFVLQLGAGGGWDSKTFGDVLTADGRLFAEVVNNRGYRMLRQGTYHPGDQYPKSRRVVLGPSGQPHYPLGWIKVRMERVK